MYKFLGYLLFFRLLFPRKNQSLNIYIYICQSTYYVAFNVKDNDVICTRMTHEREKVNNVIKIFLCFVIDFMNVCFLHFTKKKKLESKISNSTYFSSRRSRRSLFEMAKCIECGQNILGNRVFKGNQVCLEEGTKIKKAKEKEWRESDRIGVTRRKDGGGRGKHGGGKRLGRREERESGNKQEKEVDLAGIARSGEEVRVRESQLPGKSFSPRCRKFLFVESLRSRIAWLLDTVATERTEPQKGSGYRSRKLRRI